MLGGFSTEGVHLGGEAIKNNMMANLLRSHGVNVTVVDGAGWTKRPVAAARDLLFALLGSRGSVAVLCASGRAAALVAPLMALAGRLRSHRLHYLVIGYGILDYIHKFPALLHVFRRFQMIHVETQGMCTDLRLLGLDNVVHFPNLRPARQRTTNIPRDNPAGFLRTVFLSRVVETKGIDVAVEAVCRANELLGETRVTLDIYGNADTERAAWLTNLVAGRPGITVHGPLTDQGQIPSVLARYHYMLFPSRYPGEVFPGVVLDSMAAGTPVLVSDWHYNGEVVQDGVSGYVLPVQDVEAWTRKLMELLTDSSGTFETMVQASLNEATRYHPDVEFQRFLSNLFPDWPVPR
jgi:glycosyltransferase involved in cell wall biosynthesis